MPLERQHETRNRLSKDVKGWLRRDDDGFSVAGRDFFFLSPTRPAFCVDKTRRHAVDAHSSSQILVALLLASPTRPALFSDRHFDINSIFSLLEARQAWHVRVVFLIP